METNKSNLKEIMKYRLEKIDNIRKAGHNPYAYNFDKCHDIINILKEFRS